MNNIATDQQQHATASLEHLTGPARGTASWLSGDALDVSSSDDYVLRIAQPSDDSSTRILARFHKSGQSYEIEPCEDSPIWVNGERISSRLLVSGDMIEFGEKGPLCRYCLSCDGVRVQKTLSGILADCIDYSRASRKPVAGRISRAMQNLVASLTSQTTVLFRVTVLVILVALTSAVIVQMRFSSEIKDRLINESDRMDEFARVLSQTQQETVRPVDLNALRQDFDQYLESSTDRLAALEQQSEATATIISSAADSIVFLQGAYGFREIETGRMLRYMVDSAGQPVLTPSSQPVLTLDGSGPVAERNFTGTAFVVSKSGALLTNRHVALPWEQDTRIAAMLKRGMQPLMLRFLGYLPSSDNSFEVALVKKSDEADLAILKCSGVTEDIPRLVLSDLTPVQGDQVVVMGYPTGLRSMLAQTGARFIDELRAGEELDFWQIAAHLAENDFIHPLASQGIVAQITAAAIVYDAETTHGGSGGPVLDMEGNVVAVNAAIIPGYTGSNIGVPVSYAKNLLAQAEIDLDQ